MLHHPQLCTKSQYFLHWPFDEGGCRCDRCRPWGGYGAIAMPARFERLFRQCEKVVDGFMFYSEGLSEDINKFLVTRLYADPSANWQGVMKDYVRLFLPGIKPDDFVRFCAMLEESHEFPVQDTQLGAEPPSDEVFAKCGPRTKEIAAAAQAIYQRCSGPRIDYIYVSSGVRVIDYATHSDVRQDRPMYPSDHSR